MPTTREIQLICPECGNVFSVPALATTATEGSYRPCSWECRNTSDSERNFDSEEDT